jgi:hyperosmotically inducible protein
VTHFDTSRARTALCTCILLLVPLCLVPTSFGQDQNSPPASASSDNSATNKGQNTTAEHQSDNSTDLMITKKIRQSLIADKSLSTYGHNVKIITRHGEVTLKGPVHSEEEKQAIASKAEEVAGAGKVSNQLTVKQ